MTRAPRALAAAPLLAVLCAGCFATRNDVRVLQTDIATLRAERAYGDSARGAQIDRIIRQLATTSDTLRYLAQQSNRFQGDAREGLRELRDAVSQVQEVTTQLQRRVQEMRASFEAQQAAAAQAVSTPAAPGAPGAPADSAGAAPPPNQLYQIALDQYNRGSYGTARSGFEELLRRYPTADVAADAQFYLGEAYMAERNTNAADDAYAAVVTRYPQSSRAAGALYKRGRIRQTTGRAREARQFYDEVIKRYPRSDEASLARDAVRALSKP